jgi:hypothetical protein
MGNQNYLAKLQAQVAIEFADEYAEAEHWLKKYGAPYIITEEEAKAADEHHVWTEWMLTDLYIDNGFAPTDSDEGRNASCYWYAPNPWDGVRFSQELTTEVWLDCPICLEDDYDKDECDLCDSQEIVSFNFLHIER